MRAPRSNGAAFVRGTILLAAGALGVACTDGTTPDCSDAQCQVLVEEAAAGDAGDAGAGDDAGADAASGDGAGADTSAADSGGGTDSGAIADSGAVADARDGAPE